MNTAHILVVEDDEIAAELLKLRLVDQGYQVTLAEDGQAAWEMLNAKTRNFDTILLDRSMPRMDGLTLLKKLNALPEKFSIPVVMSTSLGDRESVLEGLQAGAYYYLTKPVQPEVLEVIVRAAVNQYRDHLKLQENIQVIEQSQRFISTLTLHFATWEEIPALASWLALLCPEPNRSRVALGLHELMCNAVEHGNLGISYAEKSTLLMDDQYFSELARRQQLPENQAKRVEIRFERKPEALFFTLQDEGDGFDWTQYLDFDPERIFDPNGRGIATAHSMGSDELQYQGNGNTVSIKIITSQRA